MRQNNMLAMILAGGRGTRLYALTKKIAKPAVYYGGKYRIIDFPLSNCANSNINVVGVLTQYESVLLNSYAAAGDWMQKTVVYTYCRLVRKTEQRLTYTAGLQMQSHKISISSTATIRSMF